MSDDVLIATGQYVPIQDTVCECGHWYEEHTVGMLCGAPSCQCLGHLADPVLSTPAEIGYRGGDPDLWPDHVKLASGMILEES